jgi:hypothetical protein
MLKIPHFLRGGLRDGGEDVSLTHQSRFNHEEYSWKSLLLVSKLHGYSAAGRMRSSEQFTDIIDIRSCDLPALA